MAGGCAGLLTFDLQNIYKKLSQNRSLPNRGTDFFPENVTENVVPATGSIDLIVRAFRTVGENRRCEEQVPERRGNLVFAKPG